MTEIELSVPPDADLNQAIGHIESACQDEGLTMTMKSTLAGFPGCVHWHYKKGRARGTLEITLWPSKRRLWFAVHRNRAGDWIDETGTRLRATIERSLDLAA